MLATKHLRYKVFTVKAEDEVIVKVKDCEEADPIIDTATSDDVVYELS
jgi:hypothetical protein